MSFRPLRHACIFLLVLGPGVCAGQNQSASQPPTEQNTESQKSNTPQKTEQQIQKKEQSQRMLGVVPQFTVTDRRSAPPLMPNEKFHLFVKSAFDPAQFALVGLQAGISQAQDEFPDYGQGAEGYGKRYGAAFADQVSSGFFSNYLYPALFKDDPRYFRLGKGSTMHRLAMRWRRKSCAGLMRAAVPLAGQIRWERSPLEECRISTIRKTSADLR